MVSVFLASLLFERENDTVNTLAIAALILLTAHPPFLFSISFQLSFASVFSILFGVSWLNRRKREEMIEDTLRLCEKLGWTMELHEQGRVWRVFKQDGYNVFSGSML